MKYATVGLVRLGWALGVTGMAIGMGMAENGPHNVVEVASVTAFCALVVSCAIIFAD